MLRLHRNGATGVIREDPFHRLPEGVKSRYLDVRLRVDLLGIDLPVAESRPGEVVEEEIQPGRIGEACPLEIVRLHVVQVGHVAKQATSFTGLPQCVRLFLGGRNGVRVQVVDAVHMPGDQPHRFSVSGKLRRFPCFADTLESPGNVRVRPVHQPLHGRGRSAGRVKIGRDVVAEQVLQNVRAVVHPFRFFPQMLVGVDQCGRFYMMTQVGLHSIVLAPLSTRRYVPVQGGKSSCSMPSRFRIRPAIKSARSSKVSGFW